MEEQQQSSLGITRIVANQYSDVYRTNERLVLERRNAELQSELLDIEGRVLVLSEQNKVLMDSANELNGEEVSLDLVRRANELGSGDHEVYLNNDSHVLYTALPFNLLEDELELATVLYVKDIDRIYQRAQEVIIQSFGTGVLIIVISGFLMMLSNYQLMKPIRELQLGVDAMTRGNYEYQIETTNNTDEIAKIGRSFNVMAGRLHEIYDRQSEFVSNVSHELKTPIASLKIISQSLLSSNDVPMEVIQEFLEDINTEADRMHEIVDDLLYIAKLERKDMSLDLDISNIGNTLEETVKVVLPIAREKGMDVSISGDHKFFIEFDYNKIKQVLINLLNNAVKYSPPDTKVTVEVTEHRNEIQIDVIDQGYGIPQEDIPYLFDRFYRVDKARSRKEGGSGLGLNITSQIVSMHHGRIEVESVVNEGSTFSLFLPKRYQV